MSAPIRQAQFERNLIDIAGDLAAAADRFATFAADHRTARDDLWTAMDRQRDRDLVRLGYIDPPAAEREGSNHHG